MADLSTVVAEFAIVMTIAAVVYYIFQKLKQPPILGYLIAGVIIGPYTPPFSLIADPHVFEIAADIGVILLLFGIGLEFPLSKLMRIGLKTPIVIATIEIGMMFLISFGIGWILGWSTIDSLFLGAALASSSTVIIAKALNDMGKMKEPSTLIMMGILIAEDIFVIIILALLTSILSTETPSMAGIVWIIGKSLLFIFGVLIIGYFTVPKIIDWMACTEKNEVLILMALGLCFGLSVLANAIGLSMEIGAFLMGVLIAKSKAHDKVAKLISPIKDMFAALFFVSVGIIIDITQLDEFLLPALLITFMMIIGKMIGCGLGVKLFKYDNDTAMKVGLGMGQTGEFAFIVAKAGQELAVINSTIYPIIGISVAITSFLTPYMIKLSYAINPNKWTFRLKKASAKKD